MNKYQREVEEMDRRHHRTVRLISTFCAMALGALALWSSGVSLPQLWSDTKQYSTVEAKGQDTGRGSRHPIDREGGATGPNAEHTRQTAEHYDPKLPTVLRLISTRPGLTPADGTAIIGTAPNNGVTYVAGAILANGARLSEIYRNYVVIERGNVRQNLSLKDSDAIRKTVQASPSDLSVIAPQGAEMKTTRDTSKDALVQVIRTSPVYENDMFVGLQVFPGQHSGVFSQLGLRSGDLVTSMGGAPLSDYDSAMQLFGSLAEGNSMNVGVRRNGKYEVVSISGPVLAQAISASNEPLASQAPAMSPSG